MFTDRLKPSREYDAKFFAGDWEVESRDYTDVPFENIDLGEDLKSMFMDILQEQLRGVALDEAFTSVTNAHWHCIKHCLCHNRVNKPYSEYDNVYYDFAYLKDYMKYEEEVDAAIKNCPEENIITDITDAEKIQSLTHKLMTQETTILFDLPCGLRNSAGRCAIALRSFANPVTTNYKGDTVDFCVRTPDGLTVTLFPLSTGYLASHLNHTFTRNGFDSIDMD